MQDITLVFIVIFVGGLVGQYFVLRNENKYKRPEKDSSRNWVMTPSKPYLLLMASYLVFFAWISNQGVSQLDLT